MMARLVIGLFPREVLVTPVVAETIASSALNRYLPALIPQGRGRWWEYVYQQTPVFVLRTLLRGKDEYLQHLLSSTAHDGSRIQPSEVEPLRVLPAEFWVTEYSLPSLYTGNKSKLGEVLVRATTQVDSNAPFASVIGIRAPSFIALMTSGGDDAQISPLSNFAHSPLMRLSAAEYEW
jgi:hypothetical protein